MSHSKIFKVEAIILKRKNVGEADRILTVFSKEYGKLRVIAKGIRRITSRRAPSLEVFNRSVLLLYRGKAMDIVTETDLVDGYQAIRRNLVLINTGYYACELVDALLPERQEHRDVYDLLTNYLGNIDVKDAHRFSLRLLRLLGFFPPSQEISFSDIVPFIERIAERRIRTYHFLARS